MFMKFSFEHVPESASGPESGYSCQGYETAYCEDLEFDSSEGGSSEYELVTDDAELFDGDDSDSDIEVPILEICDFEAPSSSNEDFFADISDFSSESEDEISSEETDLWPCIKCGIKNKPFMRYCLKCWKLRKDWYPDPPKRKKGKPRPKKKRKPRPKNKNRPNNLDLNLINSLKSQEGSSSKSDLVSCDKLNLPACATVENALVRESSSCSTTASTSSFSSQDSGISSLGSSSSQVMLDELYKDYEPLEFVMPNQRKRKLSTDSQEKKSKIPKFSDKNDLICFVCCDRPLNACILHGKIAHRLCYSCAKRLCNTGKKCPFCNVKIQQFAKIR